jgi:hypothetical protein
LTAHWGLQKVDLDNFGSLSVTESREREYDKVLNHELDLRLVAPHTATFGDTDHRSLNNAGASRILGEMAASRI